MRFAVDINHPAHVHFFKHFVWRMRDEGHEVLVTASEKEMACRLLEIYGIDYVPLGSYGSTRAQKALNVPAMDWRMWRALRRFRPDAVLGLASFRAAHAAWLLGRPCVAFDDSEHARWEVRLYLPFVRAVCTPACYRRDLGPKHLRYDGYHELAYLHPAWFEPDPRVLDEAGVGCDEPLAIVRLFSWGAVHDRGHSGFTGEARAALLRRLGERARVFVLSEAPLAAEFDRYRLTVGPEKIHHLLHYARLYVGEGATMATEAGLLGTPSVYLSSLVGTMGNFDELAERYGLVYATRSADEAMREAVRLLEDPQSKAAWQEKRRRLLDEKTDVTAWMIDLARHVAGGASAGELRAWAAGA